MEADARDGYENEDGDEEMVASGRDILPDDAGHSKRAWTGNECTGQVAHRRKSFASEPPKKAGCA